MIRFLWLKDQPGRRVTCVAIEADRFAIATWNPSDQYSKRVGRAIAVGRVRTYSGGPDGGFYACHKIDHGPDETTNAFICRIISSDHTYPARARKAADLWTERHLGASLQATEQWLSSHVNISRPQPIPDRNVVSPWVYRAAGPSSSAVLVGRRIEHTATGKRGVVVRIDHPYVLVRYDDSPGGDLSHLFVFPPDQFRLVDE